MSRSLKAVVSTVTLMASLVLPAGAAWAGSANTTPVTSGDFYPSSVTFVSTQTGWALGSAPCSGGRCLSLQKTADAGRSWGTQGLPASLVAAAGKKVGSAGSPVELNVRFANGGQNGWAFGSVPAKTAYGVTAKAVLWSTHNGGRLWHAVPLTGIKATDSSILDLEATGRTAYLLIQRVNDTTGALTTVALETSPVGQDAFSVVPGLHFGLPAGGGNLEGSIVLQGTTGWVVEGNDRGTTGSARLVDGRWQDWTPPCAGVGGTMAVPAAPTPTDLYAVCILGGFGSSPLPGSAPRGAKEGSSWLYRSTNGGTTFTPVNELARNGYWFGQDLASPAPGEVLATDNTAQGTPYLAASSDGGRHWASVYSGSVLYLGFTSPSQGVAIVEGAKDATTMVMTYDGGRHWGQVSF